MKTSVIIVGQGLCGTWLSYWLRKAGVDFILIDEERPNTSTRVASGVINPVTGRRMSRTWLADQVIPFAEQAYREMGEVISTRYEVRSTKEGVASTKEAGKGRRNDPGSDSEKVEPATNNQQPTTSNQQPQTSNLKPQTPNLIQRCDIIDFFNSPDRRLDFEKKATQFAEYLQWPEDEHHYRQHFHYELGYGIIAPAYQVDLQTMLDGWRQFLKENNRLHEERFDHAALQLLPDGVQYGDICADKIIFTDGIAAHEAGFFQLLPFALNKGEALIVEIDDLPADHIYKKGNTITPWRGGYFWAGSTYNNQYTDDLPTAAFRQSMEAWLSSVVKHPFKVLDHLAAIRPATVERRPFAGWHPQHAQVGILNGTGTKGVTLAPFFAKQLADNQVNGTPIMPEADVRRFARVLQR